MKALLSLLVLLLLTPAAGASPLEEGIAAYKAGDYERAASLLLPIAEEGNDDAQLYIGLLYLEGKHFEKDEEEAADWFEKSAESGDYKAQHNAGLSYYNGRGRDRSYEKAIEFFKLSAHQCFPPSQGMYGTMIGLGRGRKVDFLLGYSWMKIASENGDRPAQIFVDAITPKLTEEENKKAEELRISILESLHCVKN